jgi:hypothetical protein
MKGTGPHQIQMSLDAGATIAVNDSSRKGSKVITDLTLKVDIWLRNRQQLAHDQYSPWTDWKKFTPRV